MVKGVNRTVIEISDTGNELFERAILFVRPGGGDSGRAHAEGALEGQARRYLSKLSLRGNMLRRNWWFGRCLRYALAVCAGAAVAFLLLRL